MATAQKLVLPESYRKLVAERPRNNEPFMIGGCIWTINDGKTRFFQGGRPELTKLTLVEQINVIASVNKALLAKADILAKAGISCGPITGVEMHYPNEINKENFKDAVAELKKNGLVASMTTANLFYTFPRRALSSTDPEERKRAIQYAKDTVDIAYMFESEFGHLPTNVFWPGGEGSQCHFEMDVVKGLHLYAGGMNDIMGYEYNKGGRMLFAGEAKPNEPKDLIILPTTADFLAVMPALLDPKFAARFGANPETAHEMLANMNAFSPVALALALGKLFHYHANWQKGLKWDQDNGVPINLTMLEVFHNMKQYGFNGYIGLDMQARPESKDVSKVMEYSVLNIRLLEKLENIVDWGHIGDLKESGTPEMAEQYVQMCMIQLLPQGVDVRKLI